jgi:hypothetical protein
VLTVEVVRITPAINQRKVFRVRLAIKQRRTDLRSPMPVGNVQTAHPVPPLPALKFGKGSQRDACVHVPIPIRASRCFLIGVIPLKERGAARDYFTHLSGRQLMALGIDDLKTHIQEGLPGAPRLTHLVLRPEVGDQARLGQPIKLVKLHAREAIHNRRLGCCRQGRGPADHDAQASQIVVGPLLALGQLV